MATAGCQGTTICLESKRVGPHLALRHGAGTGLARENGECCGRCVHPPRQRQAGVWQGLQVPWCQRPAERVAQHEEDQLQLWPLPVTCGSQRLLPPGRWRGLALSLISSHVDIKPQTCEEPMRGGFDPLGESWPRWENTCMKWAWDAGCGTPSCWCLPVWF